MKLAAALITLVLSVDKMASGSKYLDTRTAGEFGVGGCLLRTYVADYCAGEERNGFIYSSQGCRGCGDIQGSWTAFSLQGDCPDGTVFLYNETACAGYSAFLAFFNPGANETCYTVNTGDLANNTWVSLQACFGL